MFVLLCGVLLLMPWGFVTASALTSGAYQIYKVSRGDQLLKILVNKGLRPIYGPNGSWESTLKINPELRAVAGNFIYPGQKIRLPSREVTPKAEVSNRESSGSSPVQMEPSESTTSSPHANQRAEFTLGLHSGRLEGRDMGGRGIFFSRTSPLMALGFKSQLNTQTVVGVNGKLAYFRYVSASNRSLSGQHLTTLDYGVFVEHQLISEFSVGFGYSAQEDLLYRALDASRLQIETIVTHGLHVSGKWDFPYQNQVVLSLPYSYRYGFPSETSFSTVKKIHQHTLGARACQTKGVLRFCGDFGGFYQTMRAGEVGFNRWGTSCGVGVGAQW